MTHVIFWVGGWAVYTCVAPLKTEQEWMISRPNQHLSSRDTQLFAKLSVCLATLNLLITSIYAKCPRISLWVFVYSEPLYGYLRTSISPRVFIEWPFFFSGEIVACQELIYVLALPVSSAQSAAHFQAFFLDWNGNAIVASISTTPLRQWRSSRLRFRRKSIQKLNRVQGTRLVYKLMILLSSFCHSGVKLSNKLFIVQCTCRDKNEGCWYPSS